MNSIDNCAFMVTEQGFLSLGRYFGETVIDWYHSERARTNWCVSVCLCVSVFRVGAWTLLVTTSLCLFSRVLWNFEILWIHTDWCLSLDSLLLYSSQYPMYPVYIWYGYWLQLEHELDWLLCLYDNWTGIPVPWTVFWGKNDWLIPFWTCHNKLVCACVWLCGCVSLCLEWEHELFWLRRLYVYFLGSFGISKSYEYTLTDV